ncbi:flagellar biosynthesis protein FlhA [Methylomonas sp. MED-D]|uniref:Flagellar biosynthesis protein FlhA n=1 Tax=Methylomonas koyamae TaxID=702114 RepID=A0A177P7V1_9GAMM|nr:MULTISPECIES: flagellar biosynthesis protein FlhA [Methylomonas]NJA08424.1 flagellar biosynthesis protein FlhA [Methylococcaceae bacterium WWC4]MDT4330285.1 flagellar biosynthesis protein FlhA [Methylomonas sp. MV1]OAI25513.1 flagellar biosynthesis protein FlhA [Methylomonas koyamae]OHX38314.1 flagellar biosynthesis protein FlhA [Methylomonas sp. LWB]WGS86574.1 flagellar biosynthesis protein FlhA [Methylomonas sp. UP202]
MDFSKILATLKSLTGLGLGAPLLIVMLLALLILPLPPFLLDLFFTFNIAFSLIILLVVIYTLKPLEFASFPTVILIATLLRLALNVASTRVVLIRGHEGGDAAGKVIEAFGSFVIGGNFAVGIVVFVILVVINFVVVTKGAGRVAEVSARFTLDAMPGKQMAIDADLNSGLINQDEARARREEVAAEADFYGSMDGASKFVRGDAVAGIIILFVNMIGGLAIGVGQHDMSFANAANVYVLLTIGDGLVAQIPSLLLSVASAMVVTRVRGSKQDIGKQVTSQLFEDPRTLLVTAAVMGLLGIIPGMPNLVFILLALSLVGAAYLIDRRRKLEEEKALEMERMVSPQQLAKTEIKELGWDDVMPVDAIGLEVGYRLIPLVDRNQGGQLMMRIKGVRKKLSQELGFLIPSVHIRDNLDLSPTEYRISLMGVTVGEASIMPEKEMAINPGRVFGTVQGTACKDPAFGLDAVWIDAGQKDQAQTLGYTVVDPSTVVATHLSHILQSNAHELFGYEEAQQLLDNLSKLAPKLVEDLVPKTLPLGILVKVLQNLLQERVSIRDMRTIAETLAEYGVKSQDPDILTSAVRVALGRSIVHEINGAQAEIPVITLDPGLEQILHKSLQTAGDGGAGLEPGLAEQMHRSLEESAQHMELEGQVPILLVSSFIRPWLARFVRHSISGLHVLAYNEIPQDRQIRVVSTVGQRAK